MYDTSIVFWIITVKTWRQSGHKITIVWNPSLKFGISNLKRSIDTEKYLDKYSRRAANPLNLLRFSCVSQWTFPREGRNPPPSQQKSILTYKTVVRLSSVSPGVSVVHSSAIVPFKTWNCPAPPQPRPPPPIQRPFSHVNTFCCHANEKWKLLPLFALLCLWCDLQIKEEDDERLELLFCFCFGFLAFFWSIFSNFPASPDDNNKIVWQMCGLNICSRRVPSW